MIPIENIIEKSEYFYPPGYDLLIASMEYYVQKSQSFGSYSGDSVYLFGSSSYGNYGILIFGWGSCSGCDTLQACNNAKDVEELREKLNSEIKWFQDKEEMNKWIDSRIESNDWYTHEKEIAEFLVGLKT